MAEPLSDRGLIEVGDQLRELQKHPGWKVYEEYVLEPNLVGLQNMLYDKKIVDIGLIQAIRYMVTFLRQLQHHPDYSIRLAQSLRDEFNLQRSTEERNAD